MSAQDFTDEMDEIDAKFDSIDVPEDPEIPPSIPIIVEKFVASDCAAGHGPVVRLHDIHGRPLSVSVSAIRLSGGYVVNVYDNEEGRVAQVNILTNRNEDVGVQSIRIVDTDVKVRKGSV